jgi:hypothetical protein
MIIIIIVVVMIIIIIIITGALAGWLCARKRVHGGQAAELRCHITPLCAVMKLRCHITLLCAVMELRCYIKPELRCCIVRFNTALQLHAGKL